MGNDLSAKRIPWLLTGSGGYLGGRIKALCSARGKKVTPITRADVDLLDAQAVRRVVPPERVIIHCAAPVPKTIADYTDSGAAHRGLEMVRSLLATRPARLIFASSMTVYAGVPSPVQEDDAPAPGVGYAGGKRRAELLIQSSGIPATILRLPGLFGPPREGGFLFNAARAITAGNDFHIDSHPKIWAPLHVDDAAEAMIRGAELTGPTRILNVGYEGRFSLDRALRELRHGPRSADSRGVEMDLTRMHETIGKLPRTWDERLAEILDAAADV